MRKASPKLLEVWIRIAICSVGAVFIFGIVWLRDVTMLADTAGHSPVQATIVSTARVAKGRQVVTRATIDYKPNSADRYGCRVDVDFSANTELRPGQMLLLLPRKVACYQPVIAR